MTNNISSKLAQSGSDGRLERYLACESLLSDFFSDIRYCESNCVELETGKYFVKCFHPEGGLYVRGDVGCCIGNFYNQHSDLVSEDDISVLNDERERKYGSPVNEESDVLHFGKPCDYHTADGCILDDHKGPVCLAYICESQIDYLKDEFGIVYDIRNVLSHLEGILSDTVSQEEIAVFNSEIQDFHQKIRCVPGCRENVQSRPQLPQAAPDEVHPKVSRLRKFMRYTSDILSS